MCYYVNVGNTVAASFDTKAAALKRLKYFAVAVRPTIKKGCQETPQERNTSKAIRGKTIRMLKPGEFKLPI